MGAYHLNELGQRLLQGIVPDGFFDVEIQQTHCPAVEFFFDTKLTYLSISIQERVRQVRLQYLQHARSLDARYPGPAFEHELKSYGTDGVL